MAQASHEFPNPITLYGIHYHWVEHATKGAVEELSRITKRWAPATANFDRADFDRPGIPKFILHRVESLVERWGVVR